MECSSREKQRLVFPKSRPNIDEGSLLGSRSSTGRRGMSKVGRFFSDQNLFGEN